MPRIAGLNLVAVLAAAIAMYFVGFVIYGLVFQEVWSQQTLENHGILAPGEGANLTGQDLANAVMGIPGAMEMAPAMSLGFVISLAAAIGIAVMLRMTRPRSLAAALGTAAILWVGFAASTLAYNVVYSSESRIIFGIDLLHLFIGYLTGAAVIYIIDGKAIRGGVPG